MPIRFLSVALMVMALLSSASPAAAATLEQMAGQMILVGFAGDDANSKSVVALRDEIAAGLLGGVMYAKPNVASLRGVRAMNTAFLAASPGLPPFIAVDQEGGLVERLTAEVGFPEVPTAAAVAAADTPQQARALYLKMALGLADLGFTLNLGPVVDLDVNPRNPVIARYDRAFGADPETVTDYAAAFVSAHREAGMLTALKHFPGHGSSTGDSHKGVADITKTWQPKELEPFRMLIAEGMTDMVMVGHLYYAPYGEGARHLPASLSHQWVDGVLRGQLGWKGAVVSDDLEMGAIHKLFGFREAVVSAVRAGVDVLLFSSTGQPATALADKVRGILVEEARNDPAFRARIEESYGRILALKGRIEG
jgi:beta-N-acetylhexosaminidase